MIIVTPCKAIGQVQCQRCRHYSYSMLPDGICNRCAAILEKFYPDHQATIAVREALALRGLTPQDNPKWNEIESYS